mgnify:CR=1 FL=1
MELFILDGPFQGSRLAVLIIDTEHVEELRGDESIAAGHLQRINPPNEVTASHIIRHPPIRKAGRFHAGIGADAIQRRQQMNTIRPLPLLLRDIIRASFRKAADHDAVRMPDIEARGAVYVRPITYR